MHVTADEIVNLDPTAVPSDEVCDRLFAFLAEAGQSTYDEAVTQLEHGLQCAALAEAGGYGAGVQVSALLHDLGHLLLDEHDDSDGFLDQDQQHEIVGARLITRWFGQEVGAPVALHVAAKRYLVAVEPEYAAGLSPVSARSLELQGGPMSPDEVRRFEQQPYHQIAVEVRRWDDLGKVPGAEVPPLEHWRPAVIDALVSRPETPRRAPDSDSAAETPPPPA